MDGAGGPTFRISKVWLALVLLGGAAVTALGVTGMFVPEEGVNAFTVGAAILGVWTVLTYGLWAPHRVMLTEYGIVLRAVVRRVEIPWEDFGGLRRFAPDFQRSTLVWCRLSSRWGVLTLNAFYRKDDMLDELERYAPRAQVRI